MEVKASSDPSPTFGNVGPLPASSNPCRAKNFLFLPAICKSSTSRLDKPVFRVLIHQ